MEKSRKIQEEIENRRDEIVALSRKIHAEPETAFEEHKTSKLLQEVLAEAGFSVETDLASLPTAFRAMYKGGAERPCITYTAEMDALPGLGHGCGHNIIASAGVYAALVLKSILDEPWNGTIEVIGTPAEERGSGKVRLLENGIFELSDVVLQMHAHSLDSVISQALERHSLVVEYFGKKAHAASAPHEGINALDGLVLFYQSTALLRQHFPPGCRFHGIIEEGGTAANIIPDYARGRFSLRADDREKAGKLYEQIVACAKAAAEATGCKHRISEAGPSVTTFKRNRVLEDLMAGFFERRGRSDPWKWRASYGSTDLASVSQVVPTIEILLKASDHTIHTEGFARDAAGEGGDLALLDGVFCLAAAGHRLLAEGDLLRRVKEAFRSGAE